MCAFQAMCTCQQHITCLLDGEKIYTHEKSCGGSSNNPSHTAHTFWCETYATKWCVEGWSIWRKNRLCWKRWIFEWWLPSSRIVFYRHTRDLIIKFSPATSQNTHTRTSGTEAVISTEIITLVQRNLGTSKCYFWNSLRHQQKHHDRRGWCLLIDKVSLGCDATCTSWRRQELASL